MAWDFPASPSEGATYTPAGGPTYTYTSGVWRVMPPASSALSTANVSDTPPANPVQGQIWWKSDTGETFIWYDDASADTGQWVQQSDASLPDAPNDGNMYVRVNGAWVSQGLPSVAGGWRTLAVFSHPANTGVPDIFAVPADITQLRFGGRYIQTINNGQAGIQFSLDNQATWITSAFCQMQYISANGTIVSGDRISLTFMPLSSYADASPYLSRSINSIVTFGDAAGQCHTFFSPQEGLATGTGSYTSFCGGTLTFSQRPTHIRFMVSSGMIGANSKFIVEGF